MSEVVRAIGPAKSCSHVSGITPAPEAMPSVPRRVTREAPVDGAYSETPVWLPMPKPARLVATATAGRRTAQRRLRRLERVPHHAVAGLAVGAGVGELGHVALAEDDRARLAQPLHLEGVALGLPALEREAAVRGRHVLGVVEVLHDDRHAEQVALDARGALGVRVRGLRHRVLGHRDEGVEAELALVVGLDPVQVGARDRLRGRQAGVHVGHHLRDRLVDHVVAGRGGLEARLRDARQRRERRVRAVLAREREVRDRAECGGRETGEVGRGRQAGRAGRDRRCSARRSWWTSRCDPRRRSAGATSSGRARA